MSRKLVLHDNDIRKNMERLKDWNSDLQVDDAVNIIGEIAIKIFRLIVIGDIDCTISMIKESGGDRSFLLKIRVEPEEESIRKIFGVSDTDRVTIGIKTKKRSMYEVRIENLGAVGREKIQEMKKYDLGELLEVWPLANLGFAVGRDLLNSTRTRQILRMEVDKLRELGISLAGTEYGELDEKKKYDNIFLIGS